MNDIAFGSGRFNVLSKFHLSLSLFEQLVFTFNHSHTDYAFLISIVGLTASCFGLGGTLSNLLGQVIVEKLGHIASLR